MRNKKIVIISIFLLLVIFTAFVFIKGAIDSYNYDMDPANGVDILEGVGAGMLIALGMLVILCEFDVFFTVYYFLTKPKTLTKSILMIISQLMVFVVIFSGDLAHLLFLYVSEAFREEFIIIVPIFLIYVIFRLTVISVCFVTKDR